MSNFHVLSGNNNSFSVVVHVATPVGNNSAGIAWSTCLINSGMAKTRMAVGTGPGQISVAEKAAVEAGTTIEVSLSWQDDPTWTTQQRIDDITTRTSQASADRLAQLAAQLKFFGYVQ